MSSYKIIISGFGGQGILFAGKILAEAAMLNGKELSWLPSYGPEMRGGTANCHVIISDEPVGSPIITKPDILVAMNLPSLEKFEDSVKTEGMIFLDSSLISKKVTRTDVSSFYIDATQTALDEGHGNLANMVMLGALLKYTKIFNKDQIELAVETILSTSRKDLLTIDMNAVMLGFQK